ncbi:hypothetical protein HELRODRAFT_175001 [Helobdella robusta]|uniref:Uncharacterized protein n=1 Tax=Helobdella robusta TaxID=6412 RepID=T1F8Q0_HELRO|nr:hypothetical protein HELRODRAFT_175001 [Helobdella robusta]ESO01441.1 hypothetical protein HELRODRAFT_175001 [Helobdella robusta]
MWLVAKNSSLLSPDLTLIILHIALRNLRVLGSIGPRTSIHIGKNSIEWRTFPYFFIFSSAALAAAKPHFLLVRFTYRSARVPGTVTSHAKHLPALQGISVHPSGRLPSCAEMPDGFLRTGIEALEKSRQMAVRRAPSNSPNLEGSMCLDVRRKYINLGKLRITTKTLTQHQCINNVLNYNYINLKQKITTSSANNINMIVTLSTTSLTSP